MARKQIQPGEPVIYRKGKCTTCPGPRASNVIPSPRGEQYAYYVDKYWTVLATDGEYVTVVTRGGKRHRIRIDDPRLRFPTLWERLLYRARFPRMAQGQ